MSSTIYNEAVLEAKRLREVAEANAKRALVEAITPRVRAYIEKELLGEDVDMNSDLDEADDCEDDVMEAVAAELSEEDTSSKKDKKKVLQDEDEHDAMNESDDEDMILTQEAAEALASIIVEDHQKELLARAKSAKKKMSLVKEMLSSRAGRDAKGLKTANRMMRNMIREAKILDADVIRIGAKADGHLTSAVRTLRQEIEQMTRKKLRETDETMYEIDLAELDGDDDDMPPMDGDDGVADLPPAGGEGEMDFGDDAEDAAGVEIPMDLAQDLLAALEVEVEGETEETEEEEMDFGADDIGVEGGDEMELSDDDEVEIDEAVLRQELARIRGASLNEKKIKTSGKSKSTHPAEIISDFGGGSAQGEPFVDMDDSDLNVMEVKQLSQRLQNEGRKNRALRRQVASFKQATVKLQEQLAQMNLFNAKLLYVNKLMTNESVTARQKTAIIEALDKARSLREVKLLYKSLSGSLKKVKDSPALTEASVRKTASASRSARAGSTVSQDGSPQIDRWSLLAGIKKDSK